MDPHDVQLSIEASILTPPRSTASSTCSTASLYRTQQRGIFYTPKWSSTQAPPTAEQRTIHDIHVDDGAAFQQAVVEELTLLRHANDALQRQLLDREQLLQDGQAALAVAREESMLQRSAAVAERDAVVALQNDLIVEKNREIYVLSEVNAKLRSLVETAGAAREQTAAAELFALLHKGSGAVAVLRTKEGASRGGNHDGHRCRRQQPNAARASVSPSPDRASSPSSSSSSPTGPLWMTLGALFAPEADRKDKDRRVASVTNAPPTAGAATTLGVIDNGSLTPSEEESPAPEDGRCMLRPLMDRRRHAPGTAARAQQLRRRGETTATTATATHQRGPADFSPVSVHLPAVVSATLQCIDVGFVAREFERLASSHAPPALDATSLAKAHTTLVTAPRFTTITPFEGGNEPRAGVVIEQFATGGGGGGKAFHQAAVHRDPLERDMRLGGGEGTVSERQTMRIARLRSELDNVARLRLQLESILSPEASK